MSKLNLALGTLNTLTGDLFQFTMGRVHQRLNDRGGKLQLVPPKSVDNIYVYIAKRRAVNYALNKLKSIYPRLQREREMEAMREAQSKMQSHFKQVIKNGQRADQETFNSQGVTLRYQGKPANEGLLMWVRSEDNKTTDLKVQTYWDKIKWLGTDPDAVAGKGMEDTRVAVPGDPAFLDLGAIVSVNGSNNIIQTKVQGRDFSRKEFVSGGDFEFSVQGRIFSNYPDVYPYEDVSRLLTLLRYQGIIQVYNIMFQQLHVTQVLIKNFSLSQDSGFKNVQPYSFSCVAVEPDTNVSVVRDTIEKVNLESYKDVAKKKGWASLIDTQKIVNNLASSGSSLVDSITNQFI